MIAQSSASEAASPRFSFDPEALISYFEGPSAVLDTDGRINCVNQAWRQFSGDNGGDTDSAYIGANYIDICENSVGPGSDGVDKVAIALREILEGTRQDFSFTYPCHTSTHRYWYKCFARPIIEDGTIAGVIVQHIETTPEVENPLSVSARLDLFGTAADAIGAYVWEWDLLERKIYPGAGLRDLVDKQDTPWRPEDLPSIIVEEDREIVGHSIATVIEGTERQIDFLHRVISHAGEIVWLQTNLVVHKDPNDIPIRIIGFCIDITRRRETERRMQEALDQARQMALVAEKTDHAVLITDTKGNVDWVNPSFTDLTGWTLEEIHGQQTHTVLNEFQFSNQATQSSEAGLAPKDSFKSQGLIHRKDGSPFLANLDVQSISSQTEVGLKHIVMLEDMTAQAGQIAINAIRLNALEVLTADDGDIELFDLLENRLTKELSRLIPGCTAHIARVDQLENGPTIWRMGSRPHPVRDMLGSLATDSGFQLFKRRIEDGARKTILDLQDPSQSEGFRNWGIANGIRSLWTTAIRTEDGETKGAFILTVPDRDAPTVAEVLILQDSARLCADLIDRNHAAIERKFFMNRVALLAESLPVRVAFIDRDHVVRYANAGYAEFHKTTREALSGALISDLLGKEAWNVIRDPLNEALRGRSHSMEVTVPYEPDKCRDVRITWIPQHGSDGRIDGVYKVAEDLTEFRDRERQLSKAIEVAQSANDAKSRFLANMSHELRTPLNAIIGYSEVIQMELFGPLYNERYGSYIKDIHDSGAFLLELIEDVLELSRLEVGTGDIQVTHCDLNKLVTAAVRLHPIGRQRVIVSLNAHTDALVDERAVKQIIVNLLGNALKYGGDGMVSVSTVSTMDGWVDIVVEDNGPGIAPEELPRVTEPFYTVDASPFAINEKSKGAGIGLAIVKRLTKEMGGELSIESEVNNFTRVTVKLPQALP